MSSLGGGDWWAQAEVLAQGAEDVAGIELAPPARRYLVEIVVELLGLLERWPNQGRCALPLQYLRLRRARMERHAPWLYALPFPTRKLLIGTRRVPSLLEMMRFEAPRDPGTVRVWRNGLLSLADALESGPNRLRPSPSGARR